MEGRSSSLLAKYISIHLLNRPTIEPSVGHIDLLHIPHELSSLFRTSFHSLNDSLIVGADLHHRKTVYLVVWVNGAISPEVHC